MEHRKIFAILSIFYFFNCALTSSSKEDKPNPKIVIIGAGPSGVAAATKLLEYGFSNLEILEAESRIGGRINSIPFGDNVVDLGAQWCHGEKNNVVYEMVKNLDLLSTSVEIYTNYSLIRSNGEVINKDLKNRLEMLEKESKVAQTLDNITVYDHLKHVFENLLEKPENKDIDKTIAEEFFDCFEKSDSSYEGSDTLSEFSALTKSDYEACEGDLVLNWKDKGYKEFLRVMLKTHETGKEFGLLQDYVRLSKKVQKVEWNRDDLKVLVKCKDGEEIIADHVIVTVSLGVLKAAQIKMFEPVLPAQKQLAIEGLEFGTVNKIFMEFEKRTWPNDWTGFFTLWQKNYLKEIRNTSRAWTEGIFGVFGINFQPRVLEGWIIGPFGRHMETLPIEEVKLECIKIMKLFFPYEIPVLVNITRTTWSTNPNFRGSYSYHSTKTNNLGVKPQDLETPLTVVKANCAANAEQKICQRPSVLFAGEATNSKHYSTVHGAVETGWREAERLEKLYFVNEIL